MSELFMECEEEELEPWQRRIPEINLVDDDDDDEPIFVGEIRGSKVTPNSRRSAAPVLSVSRTPLASTRTIGSTQSTPRLGGSCVAPLQRPVKPPAGLQAMASGPSSVTVRAAPQQPPKSLLVPVTSQPGSLPPIAQNATHTLTAVSPQPIIINNQGYILTSPQIPNNPTFIASLGNQYPSGTSFAVLPAGQPLLQQVAPARPVPGVIHRPQVQLIQNNVVTLTSVQSPPQPKQLTAQLVSSSLQAVQPLQLSSAAVQANQRAVLKQHTSPLPQLAPPAVNNADNGTSAVKRDSHPDLTNPAKRTKFETGTSNSYGSTQNGMPFRKKCPKCNIQFNLPDPMKSHMKYCCHHLISSVFPTTSTVDTPTTPGSIITTGKGKIIMLVTDFYYGKYEGDKVAVKEGTTHTTFKCNSCFKVLKNNIRFMNHMKHHLELEKQSNESWESHTTCQHCYRQYSTPFQLQCHIESAHSPYESTTNCKICELAFESEQALLEHMKFNHKPGEMPYVCQVCNYRSSFFSDVESHFRSEHENTKDLLCPFCLKVLRSAHTYMQHYMKHQKKGIHRCGKCRLNFLTYKEKTDHKTQLHRTFKKPKVLDGLPPGTKVTIRASLSGGPSASPNSAGKSIIGVVPGSPNAKRSGRPSLGSTKSKQTAGATKSKASTSKKQERLSSSKQQDQSNQALKNMRGDYGDQCCIECYTKVGDFYAHYPMLMSCSACKYRTCCQKSFENHMIRFHSTISRDRFQKMRQPVGKLRCLTLVCLNCDFLESASGSDLMSKHLLDRPHHTCQVIIEKGVNTEECKTTTCHEVEKSQDLINIKGDECKHTSCGDVESLSNNIRSEKEDGVCEVRDELIDSSPKDGVGSTVSGAPPSPEECAERDREHPCHEAGSQPGDGSAAHATEETPSRPGPQEAPAEQDREGEEPESGAPSGQRDDSRGSVVSFEEFLSKADKTNFEGDEQRTVSLEPLTPSKVLEHEATEILQAGSGPQPDSPTGAASECAHISRPSTPDKAKDKL